MRLKLVVLPAPFGPISATVSLAFTEKLTSWTARSPPNRLLMLRMTKASAIDHRLPGADRLSVNDAGIAIGEKPEQPGGPPQDHGNEDEAIHRELHAAERTAKPALQERGRSFKQRGADHRAPQRADAADDRDQRRLDRNVEAERGIRIDEVDVLDVESAGERGEERADQVDVALDLLHVDADRFGGVLVLADRDQVIAHPRALDPVRDDEAGREQSERDVII